MKHGLLICFKEEDDRRLVNLGDSGAGDTALHLACERDDIELVQLFIDHSLVDVVNHIGNTPFHVAAQNRTTTVMECLIKKYGGSIAELVNYNGDSLLHLACNESSFHVVNLHLDHCCSVTLKIILETYQFTLLVIKKYQKLMWLLACSGNVQEILITTRIITMTHFCM